MKPQQEKKPLFDGKIVTKRPSGMSMKRYRELRKAQTSNIKTYLRVGRAKFESLPKRKL